MSPSAGIVAGVVTLALLVLVGVFRTVRARRSGTTRLGTESGSASRNGGPRRLGQQQVPLGKRIESWTREPSVAPSAPDPSPPATATWVPTTPPAPTPAPVFVSPAGRRLIAPVELWFGSARVGVVPGSSTHQEFDRFASELLSELPTKSG